jgi:hypothetical protein
MLKMLWGLGGIPVVNHCKQTCQINIFSNLAVEWNFCVCVCVCGIFFILCLCQNEKEEIRRRWSCI